jgi:hypothetical protein
MKKYLLILILAQALLIVYVHHRTQHLFQQPSPPPASPIVQPKPELPVEPVWVDWPAQRQVNDPSLGKVLSDIESHMPANHHYRFKDKPTWAHETTHGINAEIRNKHIGYNGFYCLGNKACVIQEPKTTLQRVAERVPLSLRGKVYHLYLVEQRGDWNYQPLYLCDEWVAYINGAECGKELNVEHWSDVKFSHEFCIYCLTMAWVVKSQCPDYNDEQMHKFIIWNVERTFTLGKDDYIKNVQNPDAEALRKFMRTYLGAERFERLYGTPS